MPTDRELLLELENRRLRAMNEADPEGMLALLADDHVHVMANGLVSDRRGAAEGVRNIPRTVEPRTPTIRLYGDVAVMTGYQTNHEHIAGKPAVFRLFVTQVARRADDGWKFVSMHAVLAQDPA